MRLKTQWHESKRNKTKEKSLEDIASVVSFNSWKIAMDGVLELENQNFRTDSNAHRLEIVGEYLAFLVPVSDRLCYGKISDDNRQRFITALALHMAERFAENKQELMGQDDHKTMFIDLLNQRGESYASCGFVDNEPAFDFLRYFSEQVAAILKHDNHLWVTQYVMEIDAPKAVDALKKNLDNLLLNQAVSQSA